jgi:hypothetical protein
VQTHRQPAYKREFFTTTAAKDKAWVPCAPKYHKNVDWTQDKKFKNSKWLKDKKVTMTGQIFKDA